MCKKIMLSLLFFFFSFFAFSTSVFAIEDYTISIDSSTENYSMICRDGYIPQCSDYNYMILENTSSNISYNSNYFVMFNFTLGLDDVNGLRLPPFSTSYYSLDGITQVWFRYPEAFGSNTYLVTLTESLGSMPSGSISITENGEYDVTSYATAFVDVPEIEVPGDYHNDLVNIYHSIILCGGVILVLYFFYCIYRTIIKATGGKQ